MRRHWLFSTLAISSSLNIATSANNVENYFEPRNKVTRRLADDDGYAFDLSTHSVRFSKCQYVKMYDDDVAQDEDSDSVFALKNFVIYRLCPSDECDTCDNTYGEYVLEVGDYLQNLAEFQKEVFENKCQECEENCGDDSDDASCYECINECDKYENLEDNGYIDASEFIECQKLELDNDDDYGDDDAELELYVGPQCNSDGSKIVIGVFADENCWEPYDADIEELLGYTLSYYLLKKAYSDSGCTSCKEVDWDNNNEDAEDQDAVVEFCENIYDSSAKCETKHGFDNGLVEVNGYENQIENEYAVCTFIDSLVWESYDETGELMVGATQDVILRETTSLQKGVMSMLTFSVFGLTTYAFYLQRKIDVGYPPLDIASSGGQLA